MKIFLLGAALLLSGQAMAFNLDWSGAYRFEYTEIDRANLSDTSARKSYGLNYLYLQPKFIASDGS